MVSRLQLTGITLAALQCVQDLARAQPLGRGFSIATDVGWLLARTLVA